MPNVYIGVAVFIIVGSGIHIFASKIANRTIINEMMDRGEVLDPLVIIREKLPKRIPAIRKAGWAAAAALAFIAAVAAVALS